MGGYWNQIHTVLATHQEGQDTFEGSFKETKLVYINPEYSARLSRKMQYNFEML